MKQQKQRFYPIADRIPLEVHKALGTNRLIQPLPSSGISPSNIMAVLTGEKRTPKAGEWYLSGAIAEAYMAPNDLSDEFCIVRLVKVKTRAIIEVDNG